MSEVAGEVKRTVETICCPACGEVVEASVYNGRVEGWCANKMVMVDVAAEEVKDK